MKSKSEFSNRLKRNYFFIIGFTLSILLITLSIIAPLIVAHDPEVPDLSNTLKSPQYFSKGWSGNMLGTDNLGRDIFARILVGSRSSLFIALVSVFFQIILGTVIGLFAGYYGGWVDNLFMRFADTQQSIPSLLLAIAIVAIIGPSISNLIIVLLITMWPEYARLVRSNVLIVREAEYVKASKVLGASNNWIMFTQILPNITTPLLIWTSQSVGKVILRESALSFLGLGVQPPTPSWGIMISDGKNYLINAPWIIMAPGIALMIAVLAFNFIGDGLRDAFDPKMKA